MVHNLDVEPIAINNIRRSVDSNVPHVPLDSIGRKLPTRSYQEPKQFDPDLLVNLSKLYDQRRNNQVRSKNGDCGKITYLGTHDTAKDAAVAYDRAVLKANLSTSFLNFPDMVHNLDVEPTRKKQKVRPTNSSGYRGVSKQSNRRFRAQVSINGKRKNIGTYDTALAAALAYDQAAIN